MRTISSSSVGERFVMCGIDGRPVLGGWQIPGSRRAAGSKLPLAVHGCVISSGSWFLIFVVVWIRWTIPRGRRSNDEPLLEGVRTGVLRGLSEGHGVVWTRQAVRTSFGIGRTSPLWMRVVSILRRVRHKLLAAKVKIHLIVTLTRARVIGSSYGTDLRGAPARRQRPGRCYAGKCLLSVERV